VNENIDQFGRSSKSRRGDKIIDNTNLDQSKKIKQSLAEIKEQLIQENFKIQSSEQIQSNKPENIEINNSSFKTIKELENKIKSLEFDFKNKIDEKLNSIEDKLSNLSHSKISQNKDHQIDKIENNIFFELNSQLRPLTNTAVLVINKKQSKIRVPLVNKIIYIIFVFLFIYLLAVFISLTINEDINSLKIFGKDYLIKFLEIIGYV
jgi:seryl-tRNA synthetase